MFFYFCFYDIVFNMKKGVVIFIIFLLALGAGFFYFLKYKDVNFSFNNLTGETKTPAQNSTLVHEEIATSTPFEIPKGEISRGNAAKKQLIFTFDCGSGNNSVDKIMETAEKRKVKLTFFATGKFAEKYPEDIKKIAEKGHEIFNHTYSHPHLTQITDEEIKNELEKTEKIIFDLTGKTTKPFFRPPYGDRNQHISDIAKEAGFHMVYWTFDALDWMPEKTAQDVKNQIYSKISPGAIILMHVGDDTTGNILDEVFEKVENDGYKIVNLSEGLR